MRFFFDNCVSIKFVQALRILAQIQEYELVHLTERFAPNTIDEEWIRSLADDKDWVIISGDPRISRGQAPRRTWQESGMTAFFFADGWASKGFGSKQRAWSTGGLRSFSKREKPRPELVI